MDDNIKRIQNKLKSIDYSGHKTDEYVFTISCVDYFYYNRDISDKQIEDGYTDGGYAEKSDGGIDFVYEDGEYLYLIQGKSEKSLSYKKIREIYTDILDTVEKFEKEEVGNLTSKLRDNYITKYDKLTNPKFKFVIFTNTVITDDLDKKIKDLNKDKKFKGKYLEIYGKDQIGNQQQIVDYGYTTVDEGTLLLSKKSYKDDKTNEIVKASKDNYIKYKSPDGEGIILNISAVSLRRLYDKTKDKGLFGYNLREHYKYTALEVDAGIENTIDDERNNFWFYNNGITIGCGNYELNDNELKLYDFSIINGAQTTYKIGEYKKTSLLKDFDVVCKVVKAKNSLKSDFILKISEASNSQKPIIPQDLKANSEEQKKLQNKFNNNGDYSLYIYIKRSDKKAPGKYKGKEKWTKIKNIKLGQIILSSLYQRPGTARSNTKEIFGDEDIYKMIFDIDKIKSYDYNTLYDLVRLDHYYSEYCSKKTNELADKIKKAGLLKERDKLSNLKTMYGNSELYVIAIISYFIKREYFNLGSIYAKPNDKEKNMEKLEQKMISGDLSIKYSKNDYFKKLHKLFDYIVKELSDYYDEIHSIKNYTSQSNFLKTDNTYRDVILPFFEDLYENDEEKIIKENIDIFDSNNNKKEV